MNAQQRVLGYVWAELDARGAVVPDLDPATLPVDVCRTLLRNAWWRLQILEEGDAPPPARYTNETRIRDLIGELCELVASVVDGDCRGYDL